ncbi:hydrolase 1, exosortase A system-associated [Lacimicrobium alkaliphilum]|uniref:Thioesterase n=1 Tax=Lacimicrobium alkaliphilum TaxID=1526571 RepID=A0A0U3B284_9ALTE|nr:hydrolase 1, exosortase A system-associated [Lacimicrobium alkaliphilum]ALS97673.1 thioesterase [Lacimicrobium alkaliphilum]
MEKAISFELNDQQLLGIVHQPHECRSTGVLLVVGGPQYRVGSHRQFVQLSRALASQGIASLRFDYRGMGDSEGEKQSFEAICDDIKVAADAFCAQTGLTQLVIWGLCDAASAAMMYAHKDNRVKGLVLLNPWLRSEAAMGKTMVRHYYLQRLLSKDFWKKLLGGKVNLGGSIKDAKGFVQDSMATGDQQQGSYQQRMQAGIGKFDGPICLILSGVDLTAREFEQQAVGSKGWPAINGDKCQIHRLEQADHTFSASEFKREVEKLTYAFVCSLLNKK